MSDKTLLLGTSFLGAICQGWREILPPDNAVFVGMGGPTLAKHLPDGWQVSEGTFTTKEDFKVYFLDLSSRGGEATTSPDFDGFSKVQNLQLDLRDFSRLVLIDMFFRPTQPIVVDDSGALSMHGVPISDTLLFSSKLSGLNGWVQLIDHPRLGTTRKNSSLPMITAIRNAMEPTETILVSRPRPPSANRPHEGLFADVEQQRKSFDAVEDHFSQFLRGHGIRYLSQPDSVLDEDRCYTANKFSRGPHRRRKGLLDVHMNAEYGKLIVRSMLDTQHLASVV